MWFFFVLSMSLGLYSQLEAKPAHRPPLLVHMMYFPWDRDQHLLENEQNFDHQPYLEMQKRVQKDHGRVVMWTYSKAKNFCLKHYPKIWSVLQQHAARPVMYVDVLRWLVVYHFGGIYWQYHSIPLVESMTGFLPCNGKQIRLFTECILTQEFAQQMAQNPIRRGEPEELVRVASQVFSCSTKKNKILRKLVDFLVTRVKKNKVHCDYDILYISGNAGISEYYDQCMQHNPRVELVSLEETGKMINFNPKSSWRLDGRK